MSNAKISKFLLSGHIGEILFRFDYLTLPVTISEGGQGRGFVLEENMIIFVDSLSARPRRECSRHNQLNQ